LEKRVNLQYGYFTGSKFCKEALFTDNFVQQVEQSVPMLVERVDGRPVHPTFALR